MGLGVEAAEDSNEEATGTIILSAGKRVDVRTDARVVRARLRGRFRLDHQHVTQPVAVGDEVSLRINPDGSGLITAVHERRNWLSRRAAGRHGGKVQVMVANINQVWIVQSAALPRPSPGFIDRILVTAGVQRIPVGIIFNKMDLTTGSILDLIHKLRSRYMRLGYDVLLTSALMSEGIESLRSALTQRMSVVTGPSGVGKSSLLNRVDPSLNLREGKVSLKTRRGCHTTAYATLLPLSSGGFVVDTPGIREFGVLDLEPWELAHYFPEFKLYVHQCHYAACTHSHEPGCTVKEAVAKDSITRARYRSYLNILDSITPKGQ
ncbi:MAG: ribosome small subunit-dependent GTPase A [Bacteroidota bacterium]|nr:ribosome small subunit-dependent GTPase A [Bacteroidota bacterium]MDE2833405.1 ribosome small subunit-dependent GTPase A [Bacteroidota bacterium]